MSRLPASVARLAAALLPAPLRDWGDAMRAEAERIAPEPAALRFALGCLGCAIREATAFHLERLIGPSTGWRQTPQFRPEDEAMPMSDRMGPDARLIGVVCAVAAVGLGFAYMAAAGAPASYFVMNGAALALGIALVAALGVTPAAGRLALRIAPLAMALGLLLTALWGVSADGATRWVSVGGVPLQPSLLLVPVLVLCFARAPGNVATIAIAVAALALALMPDRAMAGALAGGLAALAIARPSRNAWIGFAAASTGFAIALARPDTSPAMPFVDQIFFSAFGVHPLAGLAVLAGSLLLLAPALAGAFGDPARRGTYAAFGAVWLAVLAAAALGNYPTPLVGYGGSAIIGYLLSLTALPRRNVRRAASDLSVQPREEGNAPPRPDLSYSA